MWSKKQISIGQLKLYVKPTVYFEWTKSFDASSEHINRIWGNSPAFSALNVLQLLPEIDSLQEPDRINWNLETIRAIWKTLKKHILSERYEILRVFLKEGRYLLLVASQQKFMALFNKTICTRCFVIYTGMDTDSNGVMYFQRAVMQHVHAKHGRITCSV